jgi:LacI family transcriptional regulator
LRDKDAQFGIDKSPNVTYNMNVHMNVHRNVPLESIRVMWRMMAISMTESNPTPPDGLSQTPVADKRQRPPTMRDVAALAGVSVQTVSAVINGKPGITEETTARVLAVIKQLGYHPDYTARSLRSGRRRTIALLVSNVANSVLGRMASAAEDYAYANDYNLVLYNTHDDAQREMSYVNTAAQRSVDGVLFVAANQPHKAQQILEAVGIPSVIIDRIPEGYSGPSVGLDNVKAGRLAAEHLLGLGHLRLAHIPAPPGPRLSRERQTGFIQTVESSGIPAQVQVERVTQFGCQPGYEAMQRLLRHKVLPSAVFAATDLAAIGAMHAIRECGLSVPHDISVVGLDNIDVAAYQNPPLTTIRQFVTQLAALGVQMLLDILAGKQPTPPQVVIEPALVIRQSTALPRDGAR